MSETIDANNNTKTEFQQAYNSASGIGIVARYSSTFGSDVNVYALRLGNSPQNPLGAISLSGL